MAIVSILLGILFLLALAVGVVKLARKTEEMAKDDQKSYSEAVARLILAQQEGQIPYEEMPLYLEVARAIDKYRAGKWEGDGNVCIACGKSCERPSGDPILDLFCKTHEKVGLKLWISTAIDERLRGRRPNGTGKCIACGLAIEPCGDEVVDDFCGWHIETGLNLHGYFKWKSKNPDGVAA